MFHKLYHSDCIKTMKRFNSNCVDMTVTSPPYDNLRTYKDSLTWDKSVWKRVIEELFRITKDGGVVVWIVGDATIKGSETGTSFKQALYFMECGFNLHDTMIYQKDNPPPTGGSNRYYNHFEYMFIFTKDKPKTFNPIKSERKNKWDDKRTSRTKGFTRDCNGNFIKKFVSLVGDVKIGNIWKYVVSGGSISSDKIAHKHPAIFPEKLAEDHILSWSNPGDVVFDPFMGSGTTGKMAIKNERHFVGIEKVEEYFKISENRIKGELKND